MGAPVLFWGRKSLLLLLQEYKKWISENPTECLVARRVAVHKHPVASANRSVGLLMADSAGQENNKGCREKEGNILFKKKKKRKRGI